MGNLGQMPPSHFVEYLAMHLYFTKPMSGQDLMKNIPILVPFIAESPKRKIKSPVK